MTLDSRVHAGGGGGARSKSSSKYYLLNMIYLSRSYMKAFILGARSLRCPVGLAFIPFWGWVEGARGQNLVHLQKVVFCVKVFLKSISQLRFRKHSYLDYTYIW